MIPPETGPDAGLRDRKKEQTREALRACAARLFAERGFAATTVADIAACANVSTRTFFRYFDAKEDLLLPDGIELFRLVEQSLAARPPDEPVVEAVRAALLTAGARFAASSLTALTRPLEGTEHLIAARMIQAFVTFEERLTVLVLQRLPKDTPDADLRAAVIAGAALAAVRAVLRTQRSRGGPGPSATAAELLPKALDMLTTIGSQDL